MGKRGPVPIEIDKQAAINLAEAGWKNTWIASFFHCSIDTLTRRIPAEELDAGRQRGDGKLMQTAYLRAMGGRTEKKNADGSITVTFLQSSNDMLKYLLDRRLGKAVQTVELNPDPERPANLKHEVTDAELKASIARLESEY